MVREKRKGRKSVTEEREREVAKPLKRVPFFCSEG